MTDASDASGTNSKHPVPFSNIKTTKLDRTFLIQKRKETTLYLMNNIRI